MSINPPPKNWFQKPTGHERIWLGMAIVWCLIMSLMMPLWHFKGKQNSTGESYIVEPADFLERTQRFVENNQVDTFEGRPVAEPPPGGDAYLVARMYDWYPVLQLREGESYRLHISSMDIQHGFSLQPMNMNFHVMPGYDHVLTITPTRAGEYTIVCNEFCGLGHHAMIGKILVK
jgi:cytochrome c oxidase subunit II